MNNFAVNARRAKKAGRVFASPSLLALLALPALLASLIPSTTHAATACVVMSRKIPPYEEASKGFQAGFSGKSVEFDMGGSVETGLAMLPKLTEAGCDIVAAFGSPAIKFLKLRVTEKPLVYAMVLNPASEGIAGSNITGVHLEPAPEVVLAAIKRILPNARNVGLIYNPAASAAYVTAAGKASAALGLKLTARSAATVGDAIRLVAPLAEKSDVLWMIPDAVASSDSTFREMLRHSLQRGLPIFALSQKHVSEGALAALATDYAASGLQAGQIANRIAGGSNPGAISDEYAKKTAWYVNMKTAERLGMKIPEGIAKEAVETYR